ncbi:MAG: RNA polymerase sigma factor [Cyclobacteriaceae bacterium]|nr:RNA polymerase sigma factor [Cyclobacteriaceae bacterium HetDA_MAG_MS6]
MKNQQFDTLIQLEIKTLSSYAQYLTRDYEDAQDLLQDTLYRALYYKNKFIAGTNVRAWMRRIMKNLFLNEYNRRKRLPQKVDVVVSDDHIQQETGRNAGYHKLLTDEISVEVDALEPKLSDVFELYHKGFKYNEIAERKAIPLGTVKNRLHQARTRLQERIRVRH